MEKLQLASAQEQLAQLAAYLNGGVLTSASDLRFLLVICAALRACLHAQEMKAFHAEADLSIEKLKLQLASAQEQFAQLAAYVNGAAKTSVSDPQAFFAMLLTFARDLDSAHRDNVAADEQVCHTNVPCAWSVPASLQERCQCQTACSIPELQYADPSDFYEHNGY